MSFRVRSAGPQKFKLFSSGRSIAERWRLKGRPEQVRKRGGPDRWPLYGSKMAQRAPQNMLRGPMRLSSCPRMARERPLINFAFSCYPQPPRRGALSLEVAGFEGQREGRRRDSFSRFSALDGSRLAGGKPQDIVCGELYGFEFQSMALGWRKKAQGARGEIVPVCSASAFRQIDQILDRPCASSSQMFRSLCTGQLIDRPFASNWQMFHSLCAVCDKSTRCCLDLPDGPDSVCRAVDRQTCWLEFADLSDSVYRPVDRQTLCFELADVSDSVRKPVGRQMICFELPDVSDSVYRPVERQIICSSQVVRRMRAHIDNCGGARGRGREEGRDDSQRFCL